MKKSSTVIILLLIVLTFVGSLFYFWKRNQKNPVMYNTESPAIASVTLSTIATGKIIPEEEVSIRPNISGIIDKIYVKAGDAVKVGDKLASIRVVPDIQNVQAARNNVRVAKIDLDNQQKIFDRQATLYKQGVISANDYDNASARFEQAKQTYISANENYQIVKTGTTKGLNSLANTIVKATVSGLVLDIPQEEGNQVIQSNNFNDGSLIASIADISKMIFKGKVDEGEVGKIKEGMAIKITVGAMPNQEFDAVLSYIAPKGVEVNGAVQFEIEAKLKLSENTRLRAGLSANASIILDQANDVLTISEALVQYDKETKLPYVEVAVGDQQFERKDITLGISDGITVEVKSGLSEADQVKEWNAITTPNK